MRQDLISVLKYFWKRGKKYCYIAMSDFRVGHDAGEPVSPRGWEDLLRRHVRLLQNNEDCQGWGVFLVFVYLLFPKQQRLSPLGYCAPLRFGSFGIYSDDLACSLSAASISTTYFLRYPSSSKSGQKKLDSTRYRPVTCKTLQIRNYSWISVS